MTFLLDANILIALLDPAHMHSATVHAWFLAEGRQSFATCPLTENAVVRIVGNARYPTSPGSPAGVVPLLASLKSLSGHEFWPDEISLSDSRYIDGSRLMTPAQITDTYLLALAVARGGRLATLDRKMIPDAVLGGAAALHVVTGP